MNNQNSVKEVIVNDEWFAEVQIGEYTLNCRIAGMENDGETIILLHGFPETSYMWINLMKVLAEEYLSSGKKITGIMPQFLKDKQIYQKGLTKNIEVNTMAERKQKLEDLSDAFIAMPGGFGTLDESFQILTNGQLGLHHKPFGLLNVDGYFNSLLSFLDKMVGEKFLKAEYRDLICISPDPEELLAMLEKPIPKGIEKWF
jgi:uncharacterized protein (TIGR00730 family)